MPSPSRKFDCEEERPICARRERFHAGASRLGCTVTSTVSFYTLPARHRSWSIFALESTENDTTNMMVLARQKCQDLCRVARRPTSSNLSRVSRATRFLHSAPPSANFHPSTSTGSSTVNADEIAHFSRLSSLWWDERGEFGMLHKMNPVRMQFIKGKLVSSYTTSYHQRCV